MNPDEVKRIWDAQDNTTRISINPELLLREVRRNEQSFRAKIFWSDVLEVGTAVVMTSIFICWGLASNEWPWFVVALSMLWVAAFILIDRVRQRHATRALGESLTACAERSLRRVEHRIWLLENVFWWYLLPPGAAIVLLFTCSGWELRDLGWLAEAVLAGILGLCIAVFYGAYRLSQREVRTELRPRQRELENILGGLTMIPQKEYIQTKPRSRLFGRIVLVLFMVAVVAVVLFEIWASSAMNRATAEARAGGRPLTFAEIEKARTIWPEDQNGAVVLLAIKDRLEKLCGTKDFDQLPWVGCDAIAHPLGMRWTETDRAAVERFLHSAAAELAQIDRFRNFRGGRLPFDTNFNIMMFVDYKIAFARYAVKIKSLQVMDRAMAGDTASIVDDLGIMLNTNRVLAEEPVIIGSLVRMGCDASTVTTIEQACALNTLRPEQLIAIDGLLGGIENDKRLYWGMLGERASFGTSYQSVFGHCGNCLRVPVLHALALQDQTVGLRMLNRLVNAADDLDHSLEIADEVDRRIDQVPRWCLFTRLIVSGMKRSYELNTKLTAQIRAARAAMAAERFRLDNGQFPTSLEQLVPSYLEKVPLDPFDQRPLRYRLTGERAVFYSVGEDLKDDGGDVGPRKKEGEHPKDCGFVLLAPEQRGRNPATTTAPASLPDGR